MIMGYTRSGFAFSFVTRSIVPTGECSTIVGGGTTLFERIDLTIVSNEMLSGFTGHFRNTFSIIEMIMRFAGFDNA